MNKQPFIHALTPVPVQFPGVLVYCMSKSAVDQLTRCTALELADRGVRVNAVNPGVIVTELHTRSGMGAEKYAAVSGLICDIGHERDMFI